MAPRAALRIDDLAELSLLADELLHVPVMTMQALVVRSRRGARDGAVDDQVHAGLGRVLAAADQNRT
ncbi:MAG: hypothetical protein U1E76_21540 [Planctomycetota bacterium]